MKKTRTESDIDTRGNPISFLFKKMWTFAEGHRHLVVIALVMSGVASAITLASPLIFGYFLNEIQNNGVTEANITKLFLILLGLFGTSVGFWIFHGPSRVIERAAAFKTLSNYKEYLLSGILSLGLSWHADRDSGNTIDKVSKATHSLRRFSEGTYNVISLAVKAIGTTIILLFFNVYIGLISLIILVIAFVVILHFDKKLIPQYKKLNIFDNKISGAIFDTLSNVTTVKVLHIENAMSRNISKKIWKPYSLFKENIKLNELKWFAGDMLFKLLRVLPLMVYILFMYKNNLIVQIGTISAMYLYLSNLIEVYFTFAGQYDNMIVFRTQILNAKEIEDEASKQKEVKVKKVPNWKNIKIKDLSFKYNSEKTDTLQLDDINFEFLHKENIAVIGESGSGKTTFLKVVHGMYPSASADIVFDNNEPIKTNFENIDLRTTLVPQEPEIFSSSIKENITLGLDYEEKDIIAATDLAEFTETVEKLSNKYDSIINEKGVNLSGGQKQRLALARALLFAENKDIVLLDESTSSVDPENEVKIYKKLLTRYENKVVIASIHKMNLLKYFDRIIIFEAGKISDSGTFDDLLTNNQKFKKDWEEYVSQNEGSL